MARPRQVSDEQILEAARACFLEAGPSVSLDTIAARLGVSGPALLKRVGTKEALFLAAMAPDRPRSYERQLGAGPDPERPIPEQLAEALVLLTASFRSAVPQLLVLRVGGKPLGAQAGEIPGPAPVRYALRGWLERAVARGAIRDVDADAVADLLVSAVEARCLLEYMLASQLDDDAAWARRAVDAVYAGLAPPPRKTRKKR